MALSDRQQIVEAAHNLLLRNRRQGYDGRLRRSYSYTCPSPGRYRWQWFWDSCFHAIALSHLDITQAKAELLSLVSPQEKDGFIGHVTFWGPRPFVEAWAYAQSRPSFRPVHSQLIQPPVLAQAVEHVFRRSEDISFLREILPAVDRYYRWLADHRDPDNDGLIAIISPFESGLDHKPAYDQALGFKTPGKRSRVALEWKARRFDVHNQTHGFDSERILACNYFNVEDVMVNSIYAQGLRTLAGLHRALGQSGDSRVWDSLAERTTRSLLSKCYDASSGVFWDLSGPGEVPLRTLTVTVLFPLILPDLPRDIAARLVSDHLRSPHEFWTGYPVPSVAISEPSFEPDSGRCLWRGPTWISSNWFLAKGLRQHGFLEEAEAVTAASLALVSREGFREFFNPLTGRGMGAHDFGWSTLVVDMMEND